MAKRALASPKVNANGSKSATLSFRVRGDLYDRLKASAEARGYSLSEEIEHRLNRSMDAETLEATLRRVVREEVERALDIPITPNATTIAAMESVQRGECEVVTLDQLRQEIRSGFNQDALFGGQHGLAQAGQSSQNGLVADQCANSQGQI